jgi:hypothetical protein
MIVQKSRYVRTHVVGGNGIFDTIANIVKRITGNTVGDLAAKLLVSAGTSMASEAGKRLALRFIAAPSSAPQASQQVGSHLTGFIPPPSSAPPTAPQQVSLPHPPLTGFTPLMLQNAINHQAKLNEIMSKYTGSGVVPPLKGFTPTQQSCNHSRPRQKDV